LFIGVGQQLHAAALDVGDNLHARTKDQGYLR
jgi:hypothetical protein